MPRPLNSPIKVHSVLPVFSIRAILFVLSKPDYRLDRQSNSLQKLDQRSILVVHREGKQQTWTISKVGIISRSDGPLLMV